MDESRWPLTICTRCFKVQVVMQRATRIEARPARRTDCLAIQVLTDGQRGPASATEHCLLIEFSLGPNPGGMAGRQFMTVKAGIIGSAAVEFYRDDIELAAIMRAAGMRIYLDTSYWISRNRKFHVALPQNLAAGRFDACGARVQRDHGRFLSAPACSISVVRTNPQAQANYLYMYR